jgi:hypothetical protein
MLTDKLAHFYDLVNLARAAVGANPAAITDKVIGVAFPETVDAAEREGADKMFRAGVAGAVKSHIKAKHDPGQGDFAEIAEGFRTIVSRLQGDLHYVPELDEHIHVATLIDNPEWLDSARNYKHQKAAETLAEAKILDELYDAVMAARDGGS